MRSLFSRTPSLPSRQNIGALRGSLRLPCRRESLAPFLFRSQPPVVLDSQLKIPVSVRSLLASFPLIQFIFYFFFFFFVCVLLFLLFVLFFLHPFTFSPLMDSPQVFLESPLCWHVHRRHSCEAGETEIFPPLVLVKLRR